MFTLEQRGTFKYTLAHVLAYNSVALSLGVWRPKYIFHDWEKPWMLLIAKALHKSDPYTWVQNWHRHHRRHHIEYYKAATLTRSGRSVNIREMIIDWECSRFTKLSSPRNAYQQFMHKKDTFSDFHQILIANELKLLGLWES